MKVFVGWSGDLSRKVASILHKYLPLIDREFEVFVSKHDIESGARWPKELASRLDESNFGILCLSQDNLNKPWILFEAGALTKHVEGRACGLLLGGLRPANIAGPLAQFQHRPFDETEVRALLSDMNTKLDSGLPADQFNMVFDKWWPDMKAEYDEALHRTEQTQHPEIQRNDRELLEEILRLMRESSKRSVETPHYAKKLSSQYIILTDVLKSLSTGPSLLLKGMVENEKAGKQNAANKLALASKHDADALYLRGIIDKSKFNLFFVRPDFREAYDEIQEELHEMLMNKL